MRWAFQLSSFQKLITKPLAIATHLDDADFLAQIEAVDRFTANMIAYPGRSFGQLYHRFVKGNALATGRVRARRPRPSTLAAITAPVLVFAGATDGIAPVDAVKAVVPLLSGAARGALRDRARRPPRHAHRPGRPRHDLAGARRVGRPVVDHATKPRRPQEGAPAKKAAKKTAAKKAAAKKPAAKTRCARKPSPDADAIGVNPTRRYGSASSRSLAR